jgi:hypothetical protein
MASKARFGHFNTVCEVRLNQVLSGKFRLGEDRTYYVRLGQYTSG